ncbi:hypothetical protein [Leptolyngbya phage Lbo-JY46]
MGRGRKKVNNLLKNLEISTSNLNRKQQNQIASITKMVERMNEQKAIIKLLVDSNKEIPKDLLTSYHRKVIQLEEMLPTLFSLKFFHNQ